MIRSIFLTLKIYTFFSKITTLKLKLLTFIN